MKVRVGRQMRRAIEYVQQHPGCTKLAVAEELSPHHPTYGYEPVNRAIEAGLIRAEHRVNHYALYPVDPAREGAA